MINPETYNRIVTIGVDPQVDFCPGGTLAVTDGDQVMEPLNKAAEWTRQNNGQVVRTKDWHPEITDHFKNWPPHCVANTNGAEFHQDLKVKPEDIILYKGTGTEDDAYSGFEATNNEGQTIEKLITPKEDEKVVALIGGLATDYCVKATVLDACKIADKYITDHRLVVYVIADAIRAVNLKPDDGERAISEMKLRGARFATTEQITNGLIVAAR